MPKVRAESGVTGDVLRTVLGGTPAGSLDPLRVGVAAGPQYTRWVGARETYAWMLFAIETTEIWRQSVEPVDLLGDEGGDLRRGAIWAGDPPPEAGS